jgi:ubiquinone/menaquinone biosynthesis C-methylase UbiE
MDASARFWDRMADKYSKQPISDEATYQKKLEITRRYFRPDMEVLEIGCGTGSTAILHSPHVKRIRAEDVAPRMIEIGREKAKAAGITNIDFAVSDINEAAPLEGAYDAVLALNLLHVVKDRDAVIAKIHRALKPGGIFVSSTAVIGDKMWFLAPVLPIAQALGKAPTVRVFGGRAIRKSITDAGFAIDHDWTANKGLVVFIVAKKAG